MPGVPALSCGCRSGEGIAVGMDHRPVAVRLRAGERARPQRGTQGIWGRWDCSVPIVVVGTWIGQVSQLRDLESTKRQISLYENLNRFLRQSDI